LPPTAARLILEIDIGERLSAVVPHDKTGGLKAAGSGEALLAFRAARHFRFSRSV
jgi:hypothetical protein